MYVRTYIGDTHYVAYNVLCKILIPIFSSNIRHAYIHIIMEDAPCYMMCTNIYRHFRADRGPVKIVPFECVIIVGISVQCCVRHHGVSNLPPGPFSYSFIVFVFPYREWLQRERERLVFLLNEFMGGRP